MSEVETIEGQVVEEVGQALELAGAAPPAGLFRTEDPTEIVARATQVATTLSNILKTQRLTTKIGKSEHVRVEGWTLLGTLVGVFPVCVWTKPIFGDGKPFGWEARVEARTRDGAVVGAAEAECLRSEEKWSERDDYQLRSMAQTRATSKALRQPLGFVVSLAGFDPTPAEEMPRSSVRGGTDSGGSYESDSPRPNQPPKAAGSWAGVEKQIRAYGDSTWEDWQAFGAQAKAYMFPDVEKLSREQKLELFDVTAKAALWLSEHFDPGKFPPPTRQNLIDAWVTVLEVELAGPPWRMSPDETDREPKEAPSE